MEHMVTLWDLSRALNMLMMLRLLRLVVEIKVSEVMYQIHHVPLLIFLL